MKKKFIGILFILFYTLKPVSSQTDSTILQVQPVEYKKVYPVAQYNWQDVNGKISYSDFLEELDIVKYLLTTSYIGYNEMIEKGFNIDDFTKRITNSFEQNKEVDSKKFQKSLYINLCDYIQDAHFCLWFYTTRDFICKHGNIYYSDSYLKNINGKLFYENNDNIQEYEGNYNSSFPYPSKGKNIYRVGLFTNKKPETDTFKTDTAIEPGYSLRFNSKQTEKSVYYSLSSFLLPGENDSKRKASDIMLNRFKAALEENHNKKNIIVDLRGNQGGLMNLAFDFAESLLQERKKTDSNNEKFFQTKLLSPAILEAEYNWNQNLGKFGKSNSLRTKKILNRYKKNPHLEYTSEVLFEKQEESKLSPNSNSIYVIFDRNSASASELFYAYLVSVAKNPEQIKIVGENSSGCIKYGAVWSYLLPHSHICISIPSRSFSPILERISSWHGEGNGFFPDYWSTGEDLLETLVTVTGDEELRDILANIYYGLQ